MLRRRDRIPERRVHDDDAARCGRRNVDIVHADSGSADHLQAIGALEYFGGNLGGRANRKALKVADDRGELVLVLAQCRLEIDLDPAILEDLNGRRRQRV
jgi:hypothetical protein